MNGRVILAIVQKDIVDAVKNRYILFVLVLPVILSLLLSLFFSDSDESSLFTVAVYDQGASRLVQELEESPLAKLIQVSSVEDLRKKVEGEAVGGLVLPAGFDAAVAAGERPELTVYVNDDRNGLEITNFQRLVERQLWTLAGHELPVRITSIDVADAEGEQGGLEFRMDRYMLVMFLVMALGLTGCFVVPALLVEEKEKHTLEVLLVSPASPVEVAAAKALTGVIYSLLIAGVLVTLNRGWVGNWPITLLTMLLGALFTVAVGLLMGGFFSTTMQVNTWSNVVVLILIIPSWFASPGMSNSLEMALRLIPTYHLVQASEVALASGTSLARVWGNLAALLGWVIVAFAAVVWTLRRQER